MYAILTVSGPRGGLQHTVGIGLPDIWDIRVFQAKDCERAKKTREKGREKNFPVFKSPHSLWRDNILNTSDSGEIPKKKTRN